MTGVLAAVFGVFAEVSNWIVETIPTLTGLFYNAEEGLTILGVLGCSSLAIAIAFMLIGLIQRFFNFSSN